MMKTFTKYMMLSSAVFLLLTGIVMLFASEEMIFVFGVDEKMTAVVFQLYGGASCAFGILNWMAQNNLIGGIYSRPLIMSNLTYFSVTLITIIKNTDYFHSVYLYLIVLPLSLFTLLFFLLLTKTLIKTNI